MSQITTIGSWDVINISLDVLESLKNTILEILIDDETYRNNSKWAIKRYKGQNGTTISKVKKELSAKRKFRGFSNLKEEHFKDLGFTINYQYKKGSKEVTKTLISL